MTPLQMLLTVRVITAGTVLTRVLPFLLFPAGKATPRLILRLQALLPCAAIGMLVVYCLKNVDPLSGSRGLPELISVALTVVIHLLRKNPLISIAAGTACYMILVQAVFAAQ
jgi:branched-subunit amino acid transport protein AzlD